jgi:hypothetical protein
MIEVGFGIHIGLCFMLIVLLKENGVKNSIKGFKNLK